MGITAWLCAGPMGWAWTHLLQIHVLRTTQQDRELATSRLPKWDHHNEVVPVGRASVTPVPQPQPHAVPHRHVPVLSYLPSAYFMVYQISVSYASLKAQVSVPT